MTKPIRFAHFSDTHIGPTRSFELYEAATAPRLEHLVRHLNEHHRDLDFVVHTGDVVADPDDASFELAGQILRGLTKPLVLVNGNHDRAEGLRRIRIGAGIGCEPLVHDPAKLAYQFAIGGERFVVLDGRGPDEIDPQGDLSLDQLDAMAALLRSESHPLTVFIHFPALPLDTAWLDRMMLIRNGDQLHQILAAHRDRVRGVFSGHVHRGMQRWQAGVLYCSAPSTFAQFRNWPGDEQVRFAASSHVFYNLVTLEPDATIVRQLWCDVTNTDIALDR